ncbi:unnamed protein product [Gongylonema pulchrum]|uniref:Ovule protein n=1 Tax=Gongylonema pulchrum TaxID=637853 RepID=A0A183DU25_9BILA|nr:unnamed protein product [Gongylonema pulchrum]
MFYCYCFIVNKEWITKSYIDEIRSVYLTPLINLCSGKQRVAESLSKSERTNDASDGSRKSVSGRSSSDLIGEKLQSE